MDEKITEEWSPNPSAPSGEIVHSTRIPPRARKLYDPEVTLEEYHYYARQTREEEKSFESPKLQWRELLSRKSKPHDAHVGMDDKSGATANPHTNLAHRSARLEITDEEWANASRAMRTASWGAAFYLVSTSQQLSHSN